MLLPLLAGRLVLLLAGRLGPIAGGDHPPHELGEVDAAAATSRLLLLLLLAVLVGECEVGGSAGPGQGPLLSRLGCATMRTALAACAQASVTSPVASFSFSRAADELPLLLPLLRTVMACAGDPVLLLLLLRTMLAGAGDPLLVLLLLLLPLRAVLVVVGGGKVGCNSTSLSPDIAI